MRIAIDARMMGAGKTRGIGRYIEELTKAMRELRPEIEFVLVQPEIRWYSLAEQLRMPKFFKDAKADLVWVPHWNVPLLYRGPLAITVHDLLLLHQPGSAKASTRSPVVAWLKRISHRIVLRSAIQRAQLIFVPTNSVSADIVRHFPSAKERIVVTGEGIDHGSGGSVQKVTNSAPSDGKWSERGNYLLYVGAAYPHKRLDLLIEAWKYLAVKYPDLKLVIAGELDVFMKRAQTQAKALQHIEFTGRVSDQELARLMQGATGFVFPSSFEGFGLPPLEALAAGTPVVSSDIAVLREVLPSEGIFFFKDGHADDMLRAIETMLAALPEARAAAATGAVLVRERWSWKRAAELTLLPLIAMASRSRSSTHAAD